MDNWRIEMWCSVEWNPSSMGFLRNVFGWVIYVSFWSVVWELRGRKTSVFVFLDLIAVGCMLTWIYLLNEALLPVESVHSPHCRRKVHITHFQYELTACLKSLNFLLWRTKGSWIMWVKQCHKPRIWEWFIPPINMVMWGWFMKLFCSH